MTAWYDKATFYHMYPLGMTGSPFANPYPVSDGAADGTNRDVSADSRMDELILWIPYLESLHISADGYPVPLPFHSGRLWLHGTYRIRYGPCIPSLRIVR